jgi:uncharacterized protein YraI
MKYVSFDGQTTTTEKEDDKTTTSSEVVSDGKTSTLGYAVIDLGSLNVRSGPGTKYEKVTTVSEGNRYAYYQKEGNWIRIKDGWISTSYAYIEGSTASDGGTGTVTATELNIRKGPDASYSSNGVLKQGDSVTILAQVGDWGYTSKGWVSMKYLKADTTASTEPEVGSNTTFKTGKATVKVNTTLTIRKDAKADAENRLPLCSLLLDQCTKAGTAQLFGSIAKRANAGENDLVCRTQHGRVGRDHGIRPHGKERGAQRKQVAYAVINDCDHQRAPFVEGISSANAGSIDTAWRRLLATDLKVPSMIWWLFFPSS